MKMKLHQLASKLSYAVTGAGKAAIMSANSFLASAQMLLNQGWTLELFYARQPSSSTGSELDQLREILEASIPKEGTLKNAKSAIVLVMSYDHTHPVLRPLVAGGEAQPWVDDRVPTYYVACFTEPLAGLKPWRPGRRVPLEKGDAKPLLPQTAPRIGRLVLQPERWSRVLAWHFGVVACLEIKSKFAVKYVEEGPEAAEATLLAHLDNWLSLTMVHQLAALVGRSGELSLAAMRRRKRTLEQLLEHAVECNELSSTVSCAVFTETCKGAAMFAQEPEVLKALSDARKAEYRTYA